MHGGFNPLLLDGHPGDHVAANLATVAGIIKVL